MKTIGLLCSGGDAPGMNAVIRSVVRTGIGKKLNIIGIERGYAGLLDEQFVPLDNSSVGNIIQRGGTIIHTSRCPEFRAANFRKKAFEILKKKNIDALIIAGGDGSFNGAWALHSEFNFPVMGVPCTIDNDISGTEYTIGFDTAVQTAIESVDKIRDTASSHARTFIIEVMGRESAHIALSVGVCTGAENIVLPNEGIKIEQIYKGIENGLKRGKDSSIIIVAEGKVPGVAYQVQENLNKKYQLKSRVCVLGHTQRGGSPVSNDRLIAGIMGHQAVHGLLDGHHSHVTAMKNGSVNIIHLEKCLGKRKESNINLIKLANDLSI